MAVYIHQLIRTCILHIVVHDKAEHCIRLFVDSAKSYSNYPFIGLQWTTRDMNLASRAVKSEYTMMMIF